jgi:thiamine phosphate synthase YjbQ (UPF0047 family)
MRSSPAEINLELAPAARVDVIDVSRLIADRFGDAIARYPKALYCSFHTTAGYLDQPLCNRLNYRADSLQAYVRAFQQLFPPEASYRHDQLDLRLELTEEERRNEPRNADSHLTFIGAGLESCVSYVNQPDSPVYFVDLDGINGAVRRRRRSSVIGYSDSEVVDRLALTVPVSGHSIDSVSLRDARLGFFDFLQEKVDEYGIEKGWVELTLDPEDRHAGLTINEFETLLMKHDLIDVLRDPIRFMTEKGKNMLRDPRAIPLKARSYAKYDLVRVINEFIDALGLSESLLERLIDKLMAVPASRFLRMKRSVRLLVSDHDHNGRGTITHGRYQSPILVQWQKAAGKTRHVHVSLVRLR